MGEQFFFCFDDIESRYIQSVETVTVFYTNLNEQIHERRVQSLLSTINVHQTMRYVLLVFYTFLIYSYVIFYIKDFLHKKGLDVLAFEVIIFFEVNWNRIYLIRYLLYKKSIILTNSSLVL